MAKQLEPIEIDGSLGEGGGQILRTSVALASIFEKPIRITNIRAKRKEPGLRPQHLQSVKASAKLCGAELKGAKVGSTQIQFTPGKLLKSFGEPIDTGTAGSISLIAQTIIPISLFGGTKLDVVIVGGTEVPNSPTFDYVQKIVVPIYRRLGANIEFNLEQRGYYPKGGGIARLRCSKVLQNHPLLLIAIQNDKLSEVTIQSNSRLLPKHVSMRQVEAAKSLLKREGIEAYTSMDNEGKSLSPGSSVLIFSLGENQYIGSSALGERGKPSERVGEEAAKNFLKEIVAKPNVDSHLADMLVTLLCCVNGSNTFTTSKITDHFTTNAEVAKKIANCEVEYRREGELWRVLINSSSEKPN